MSKYIVNNFNLNIEKFYFKTGPSIKRASGDCGALIPQSFVIYIILKLFWKNNKNKNTKKILKKR